MKPEWRRVEDVLTTVLDLPAELRKAQLDRVCGDDPELRREVESLLAADAAAGDFLARPMGRLTGQEPDPDRERDASQLPRYRLRTALSHGATASVYLATRQDLPDGQPVAVKVLRGAPLHDAQQRAELRRRFERERRVLAQMRHPNIARLFDAGVTADGRPFLVMEYFEGVPLDRYCTENRLSVTERLQLFLGVCDALQYAHQNLLVHRDVKPDNILVTAAGVPKLLDFGIAKPLHPERFGDTGHTTALNWRPMTPRYASPEQVRGDSITPASDVYALGVVLYELLSGRSPYKGEGLQPWHLERAICDRDPEPVSRSVAEPTLQRRLRGDLDAIVQTALAKRPADRYPTVERLAEDLRRHLESRPVRVRSATLRYRAGRWVRRHRWAMIAGVLGVLAGIAFVTVLLVQNHRVETQRQAAERERQKAEQALDFMMDTFRLANPTQVPEDQGARQVTALDILDAGAQRAITTLEDQPEVQAALLVSLGRVYTDLGEYPRAAELVERSVAARRHSLGDEHPLTAESLGQLALIYNFQGRYEEAAAVAREALEGEPAGLDPPPIDRIMIQGQLAQSLRRQGRLDAAEALLRDAAAAAGDHPARSQMLAMLGAVLGERGRFTEAEERLGDAMAIVERAMGAGHPLVGRYQLLLAEVLNAAGRPGEARRAVEEGLENLRDSLEPGHPLYAEAWWELGRAHRAEDEPETAAALWQRSLDLHRRRLGDGHPRVVDDRRRLVALLRDLGRTDEAETLEAWDRVVKPESGPRSPGGGNLLDSRDDQAVVVSRLWSQLAALRATLPPDDPRIAEVQVRLGRQLVTMGRSSEAEPHLRAGYQTLEEAFGADDERTRRARRDLDLLARREARDHDP